MMKKEQNGKRKPLIHVHGEVVYPIKVGEPAYYRRGKLLVWTERIEQILEVTADYVKLETKTKRYMIERTNVLHGQMKLVS